MKLLVYRNSAHVETFDFPKGGGIFTRIKTALNLRKLLKLLRRIGNKNIKKGIDTKIDIVDI